MAEIAAKVNLGRVYALKRAINFEIESYCKPEDDYFCFSLDGDQWYLKNKNLTGPELAALEQFFEDKWALRQRRQRCNHGFVHYLKFNRRKAEGDANGA